MPLRLHVTMLGRFSLWEEDDGGEKQRSIHLPATARSQSLLAYLLLHREKTFSREALAEMFWSGRPPQRARRSLSTALWRIRRSFAPLEVLQGDHQFVQMVFPGEAAVDVEMFTEVAARAGDASTWQQAVDLYGGELLPGFYDDWVVRQRDWLQALYQDALLHLMAAREARGEPQQALETALLALTLDECNEAAHRTAMRAYARLGQRTAVQAQYQRCQEALARELGVSPSAETTAQFRALMAQKEPSAVASPPPTPPPRPSSRWTASRAADGTSPLVGRDEELDFLREQWRRAQQGRGGTIFLRGEAGIGKTRLLTALGEEMRRGRGWVIAVASYEHEQGQPYGALVDVLRDVVADAGPEIIRQLPSWQVANLARLAPELRHLLPAHAHAMTAVELEQRQILRAMTSLLIALARRSPLLLLMDDLQWAHESTLAWLPMLAETAPGHPLLWVGAYRTEDVAAGDLLSRILLDLERKKLAQSLTLSRLSLQDVARWLPGLDESTIARIHRHTEGNPFFVLETVRAMLQQENLRETAGGYRLESRDFTPPLPDSVRQAIEIRLAGLSPQARQGLAAAAVIGRVFDLDVWMQVWGRDEETALEVQEELLRERLLQEGEGAFTRDCIFEHHLVRETVYLGVSRRRRQQWHLAAAAALKTLRGGEPGVSAEIAFHYLRADQPQQARPWLLRAGDQAVSVAATGEALRFYQRALAGFPRDETHRFQRAVLTRKIGETHFRRGEYDRAEAHLLQALALLEKPFPAAGFSLHRAVGKSMAHQTLHRLTGRGYAGRRRITPALREEVTIYTVLGWMYSLQSRYEEYLLVSLRALNCSEDAGYARGIAVAATALGLAADFMARFGLAERFHRRAQSVVARVDQPADAGFAAFGQAYHAYLVGEEEIMLAQAALAAEKYRQAGDVHRWSLVMLLQGYVLTQRGRLQDAADMGRELAKTGQALQDAEVRCAGESLLGLVGFWRGRWREAAAHHAQAAALAENVPDHMSLVENLAGRARCLLRLGRWDEARQALDQARTTVLAHDIKGDVAGKFSVVALEAALWLAEHQPEARTHWLAQAKTALAEAHKQANAFRPAQPEVWRLCGRYEWLRGRPDAARRWWEKSLARAEALDHRLDWAVTALEMGLRLDAASLRAQGRARLEDAGARGEMGFGESHFWDASSLPQNH